MTERERLIICLKTAAGSGRNRPIHRTMNGGEVEDDPDLDPDHFDGIDLLSVSVCIGIDIDNIQITTTVISNCKLSLSLASRTRGYNTVPGSRLRLR